MISKNAIDSDKKRHTPTPTQKTRPMINYQNIDGYSMNCAIPFNPSPSIN